MPEQSFNYSTYEVQMRNFNFLYGTVEFRMKIGGGSASGAWPVVWLLDSGCQPSDPTGTDNNCNGQEIDIAEFMGTVDSVNQQIHVNSDGHNDGCTGTLADASQNFHTYDLIWAPGSLVWQVDGTTTCTINQSYVPSAPMYLKMSMFLGGLGGTINNSSLPWTTQFDYVKVTQGGSTTFFDDFAGSIAPAITSSASANGAMNSPFSYQITATKSPTSYNATGLPAGLSVNTATGLISGTPTTSGTSTVGLSATNSSGTGTANLTLALSSASAPAITSATTASGTMGTAFSYQITATNSPTSYGCDGAACGLASINTATGLISGSPSTSGTSAIGLTATNSNGTGSASLTLKVSSSNT